MSKNHRDQTQFSPEKRTLEKGKWVCYYLHICYLLSHTDKQIYKQAIDSFNDIQGPDLHIIQGPDLHIIQYDNIYKTVIIMMITTQTIKAMYTEDLVYHVGR